MTTSDLYTPTDIKKVRELLLVEQDGKDKLTGIPIPLKSQVLDHAHDEQQFVRGVLHRNCNSALGRIENLWTRELSWWYPGTLSQFLRQAADYLELEVDKRYRHVNWQKKVKVAFNKLSAKQQNDVLQYFGSQPGSNPKQRKELFRVLVMNRELGYDKLLSTIKEFKYE